MMNSVTKAVQMHGLLKHKKEKRLIFQALGTPSGTRTLDTLIKSQVLYQLS